jgi:hypothetical protein
VILDTETLEIFYRNDQYEMHWGSKPMTPTLSMVWMRDHSISVTTLIEFINPVTKEVYGTSDQNEQVWFEQGIPLTSFFTMP